MKSKTMQLLGLFVILALLLAAPLVVKAASLPQLQLSTNSSRLNVGQEVTLDVLVKNAPSIYGADVRLAFDPKMVEVVDEDRNSAGIQLKQGNFIDPGKSFIILHKIDNTTGTIGYALTLLNPAKAVSGNGQLAHITFKAKAAGQTNITVTQGAFGTKTGEKINPLLDSAKITLTIKARNGIVSAVQADAAANPSEPVSQPAASEPVSQVVLFSGLGGFGLIGCLLAIASFKQIQPRLDHKPAK